MQENYLTCINTENATHRGIAFSNLLLPIGKMSISFRELLLSSNYCLVNFFLNHSAYSNSVQQYENSLEGLVAPDKFSHRTDILVIPEKQELSCETFQSLPRWLYQRTSNAPDRQAQFLWAIRFAFPCNH